MNLMDEIELPLPKKASRDALRASLKEAKSALLRALEESLRLEEEQPSKVEHRFAALHVGAALNGLQLAQLVMRKRKRAETKTALPASLPSS